MSKLFFLLIALCTILYANEKIEIYATSVDSKDDVVNAYGDVTVIYEEYILYAKDAIYNRDSGELELFENVRVKQGDEYKLLGSYAKLNIKDKTKTIKPFFLLDKESSIWIAANSGCEIDEKYEVESGVMSGCNPNNPLWKMEFTSSDYNTDTKWVNLYNTVLYIYDIPLFYTPYFGFSMDKTRRTGLLKPTFGLSDAEGFFYAQSLYIAEQNWWDLEIQPQYRSSRGSGIYSTLRFIDSKTSNGEIKSGYFKELPEYFERENIANNTHYGFNIRYINNDFLNQWFSTTLNGQSNLYIDINNMNDVDYISLEEKGTYKKVTSQQVLSRINLFNNDDRSFYGLYFKYYKDLTKESNEETLQKLPTIQYHNYLSTLFNDYVFYNFDIQSHNIYREVNKKAIQTDFNLPVTIQTSLFDEYLNLSYKTQAYAQHSQFSGSEEIYTGEYNNGYYARTYNLFNVSTQLTKAYNRFTHAVSFGSSYTNGVVESFDGYYVDNEEFCSDANNKNESICDFYNISKIKEELKLDFSQYIFDSTGREKLYHRLAQIVSFENNESTLGELENELNLRVTKSISLYNNMFYNYDEKLFSKTFNKFSYSNYGMNISLSHLYKNSFLPATDTYSPYTSYLTSSARYTYNEHYSYHMRVAYDLELDVKKSSEIGFLYKKRCWEFGLRYVEDNRPILAQSSASSVYDRYIYINILLKPLMPSMGVTSSFLDTKLPEALEGK